MRGLREGKCGASIDELLDREKRCRCRYGATQRWEIYSPGVEGTWIKVGGVFARGEGKYGEGVEKTLERETGFQV